MIRVFIPRWLLMVKKKRDKSVEFLIIALIVFLLLRFVGCEGCELPPTGGNETPTPTPDVADQPTPTPPFYCESEWPPVNSQSDCDVRAGCDSDEYCKFRDGGIVGINRCECTVPAFDCASSCVEEGLGTSGYCVHNQLLTKYPCGDDARNGLGLTWCNDGNFNTYDYCCCT